MPHDWDMTPPATPHPADPVPVPTWTLGDRLRKARRSANLQANELADKLGVHHNTISNYENDRGHIDRRTLIAWAWTTGVPIEWLETGDDGLVSFEDRRSEEKPFRGKDRRSLGPGRNSAWSHTHGLLISPRLLGDFPDKVPDDGSSNSTPILDKRLSTAR